MSSIAFAQNKFQFLYVVLVDNVITSIVKYSIYYIFFIDGLSLVPLVRSDSEIILWFGAINKDLSNSVVGLRLILIGKERYLCYILQLQLLMQSYTIHFGNG